MAKNNYFFERKEFKAEAVRKPYYLYKGYKSPAEAIPYPVILHFGKDEIVFSFQADDGTVNRVFSLYVANGEINQNMLTRKIENYWKMPLWPLNKEITLEVDKTLLSISYFSSFYEFDVKDEEFVKCSLFKRKKKRDDFRLSKDTLQYIHLNQGDSRNSPRRNKKEYKWEIKEVKGVKKISASHINFRKIILDFLFELDYANTFEDDNFFNLQPALQNNKLLDALSRKCRYLDELYKRGNFVKTNAKQELPKQFRDAEKSWLNVCFQDSYKSVFTSADSIFDTVEEEAENVIFYSRIGKAKRSRTKYFTKDDKTIRNQSATFFLRRYSVFTAFKVLLPLSVVFLLPFILLLIPAGDFFIGKFTKIPAGISTVGIPVLMLFYFIWYYVTRGINLFKLVLPRMFLGIMLGWSVFMSTEELWKAALISQTDTIIILNLVLILITTLYIFTDIRNKLIRINERIILRRSIALIVFAMLISFVQGYYVVLFEAKPILENSGFLSTLYSTANANKHNKSAANHHNYSLDTILGEFNAEIKHSKEDDLPDYAKYSGELDFKLFKLTNFQSVDFFLKFFSLRFIWSILLSQFMMSILIGLVLQLLWEDKPITEPL